MSNPSVVIVDNYVEAEHLWLQVGAIEKAKSVIELAGHLDIQSVIEIGAGSGALLEQLDSLGFAKDYYALEPSQPLYSYLTTRAQISRLRESSDQLIENSHLGTKRYDLASEFSACLPKSSIVSTASRNLER